MYEKRIIKLLKALNLLARPQGCTIKEMQIELEISRRSTYRLLDTLQELNFPIYDERIPFEKEKRWKLEERYLTKLPNIDLPKISFTFGEVILIQYLITRLSAMETTTFKYFVDSILKKISAFTPNDILKKVDFIENKSVFVNSAKLLKDYSGKEVTINTIMNAIINKNRCFVVYDSFSSGDIKQFYIDPLKLFEYHGGLYLFVRVPKFDDIRMLAVERIKKIKAKSKTFDYPADFDAESLLKEAFHITFDEPIKAKIWFSKNQAKYIKERKWFNEQEIAENIDGSIILTLKTQGLFDLKRWILSYGSEVRVIEPEFLINDIVNEAKKILENYIVE